MMTIYVFLNLLDLSAAFDTIDHEILLSRLKASFRVTGTVLNWFKSYISNRTQQVSVCQLYSEKNTLEFGVPQGSVLGPILYTIYTQPLSSVLKAFNTKYHFYADDSQLYKGIKVVEIQNEIITSQNCIMSAQDLMTNNMLKANESKTEFIVLGKPSNLSRSIIYDFK